MRSPADREVNGIAEGTFAPMPMMASAVCTSHLHRLPDDSESRIEPLKVRGLVRLVVPSGFLSSDWFSKTQAST